MSARNGPNACSAVGLPRRSPVARPSQKLPPTKAGAGRIPKAASAGSTGRVTRLITGLMLAYAALGGLLLPKAPTGAPSPIPDTNPRLKPCAAASVAQVHKGSVNGKSIAIKILRPKIRRTFENNLKKHKVFFKLLNKKHV